METLPPGNALRTYVAFLAVYCILCSGCGPTGRWRPIDFFSEPKTIALVKAVESGDAQKIKRVVADGANINTQGKDGVTPLLWAIWSKSKGGFLQLLELGANPNLQLTSGELAGESATSISASATNDSYWLETILKHGGNPNLINPNGFVHKNTTPIFNAIDSRRVGHLDLLILAGANLDHQNDGGYTPLIYAASCYWYEGVYRLLEAGADYKKKTAAGHDLAFSAVEDTPPLSEDTCHWRQKVWQWLENHGVDLNAARRDRIAKGFKVCDP